ncbi:MAG: cysteine desulfurase family protein [Fimbriimonadales bacterium]
MASIYFDHAATTPLDSRVREAMLPWLDAGNPSSLHGFGRKARLAIDEARETIADTMGCLPGEVIFTSSGTEAANLALIGTALANRSSRNEVLIGATEHHCVIETRATLERLGMAVHIIPAMPGGWTELESVSENILLVSVMHANNETGAINDSEAIGRAVRINGAYYHCDAVQTFGVLPVKVDDLNSDLVSLSGHKIYGPKGVGALYVRAGTKIKPLLIGGGQERGMRAGTENVAAIVGFAEAAKIAFDSGKTAEIRDRFVSQVRSSLAEAELPTPVFTALDIDPQAVLPGHAHLRFPGISAESMLINLDRAGIAASSGAACSSGSIEPSHVLIATGLSEQEASEGLRFTFGRGNTIGEADEAAGIVAEVTGAITSAGAARHRHP